MNFIFFFILISSFIYIAFQIWITWGWWFKVPLNATKSNKELPISVIIAAHNEYINLKKFLPSILSQDYRHYEVIVALDRCTDDSKKLLENFQKTYSHLRIASIQATPDNWASKKWALTQGVAHAQYEYLALTDADCLAPPLWLQHISAAFEQGKELVLGIGRYEYRRGLLNLFIRFETFYAAFQYIGMSLQGIPYMGVGRNLAYTQSFFHRKHGFEAFQQRLSGDDDLLVNAYAKAHHTTVIVSTESHTLSIPKEQWKYWLAQKFRHLSASSAYSVGSQTLLGIFHASHTCFYAGILVSLCLGWTNSLIFSLYWTRILISWIIFFSVNNTIQEKKLLCFYPFLDIMFFIYNLFVVPVGIIKRPEWITLRN